MHAVQIYLVLLYYHRGICTVGAIDLCTACDAENAYASTSGVHARIGASYCCATHRRHAAMSIYQIDLHKSFQLFILLTVKNSAGEEILP